VSDDSKWWKHPEWVNWLVEYFDQLLEEEKEKWHPHYAPDPGEISVFNAFTKSDIRRLDTLRSFMLPYLRTRPSKFDLPVSSDMFDSVIGIIKGDALERSLWSEIGKDRKRDRFAWELKLYAHRIFEELKQLEWLMSKSAGLEIPVATPRVKVPRGQVKTGTVLENNVRLDSSYLRAYQIYHSEVEVFPELRTIKDVLRLRQKPEIRDFRDCLREWGRRLRAGDYGGEQAMRQEIGKANQELRRLGPARKVR
ncbi:unnamed protein product, partial [marine sediment metagenome]